MGIIKVQPLSLSFSLSLSSSLKAKILNVFGDSRSSRLEDAEMVFIVLFLSLPSNCYNTSDKVAVVCLLGEQYSDP